MFLETIQLLCFSLFQYPFGMVTCNVYYNSKYFPGKFNDIQELLMI